MHLRRKSKAEAINLSPMSSLNHTADGLKRPHFTTSLALSLPATRSSRAQCNYFYNEAKAMIKLIEQGLACLVSIITY